MNTSPRFRSGSPLDSGYDRMVTVTIVAVIWALLAAMVWIASTTTPPSVDYFDYWIMP